MVTEYPADAQKVLDDLKNKTQKQAKDNAVKSITNVCRVWDGDKEELTNFVQNVENIAEDTTLASTVIEDLRDFRGNLQTRMIRSVRATAKRTPEFNNEVGTCAKAMGAITRQALVKKHAE